MIGPFGAGLSSFKNLLEKLSVLSLRKSVFMPPPDGFTWFVSKLSYLAKGSQAWIFGAIVVGCSPPRGHLLP